MAKKTKRRQTKTGRESQTSTQTPSPVSIKPPQIPTPPSVAPQIPQEIRDELTIIMQELLLKTHELSFEYSTCDCKDIQNCQLAQKSKELFKVVKRLNQMMRRIAPPTKLSYVE